MKRVEAPIMTIAELILDGVALNEAALCMDWDEARFRCQLLAGNAEDAGLHDVLAAAVVLAGLLGPAGSDPRPGYGQAINDLSSEVDALRMAGPPSRSD